MEIEKSHSQVSETEESQWLVPVRVQRLENQACQWLSPSLRAQDDQHPAQAVRQRKNSLFFCLPPFYLGFQQVGRFPTHVGEDNLLYLVYGFEC